jgi:hypothetical protein
MENITNIKQNTTIVGTSKVCRLTAFFATMLVLFLSAAAQDRMIPSRIRTGGNLRGYETALFKYFDVWNATGFAYLVEPSFSPEYCLTYDYKSKSLLLKKATKNIWYAKEWYKDELGEPSREIAVAIYRLAVSDSLADSLKALIGSAVITSSFMGDTVFGGDGVTYNFIIRPSFAMIAQCWSPKAHTNCGQAVAIMEKLCKAVEAGNNKDAESQINEIIRVTNIFRSFYPAGFHQERFFW